MDEKQLSILNLIQCSVHEDQIESHINDLIDQISKKLTKSTESDLYLLENLFHILKIKIGLFSQEELYPKEKMATLLEVLFSYASNNIHPSAHVPEILEMCLLANPEYLQDSLLNVINKSKSPIDFYLANILHDMDNGDQSLVQNVESHLKLFQTVLGILEKRKDFKIPNKIINNQELMDQLINIICFGNDILALQCILCIVPKFLNLIENNRLLINLWKFMIYVYFKNPLEETLINRIFLILCMMKEYFLPKTSNSLHYILLNDEEFWMILQENLISSNSQIRKQALFILKRAILISSNHEINVKYLNLKTDSLWNCYIILLESLEERQIHIISPTLYYVSEICNKFHISWNILLFNKMLYHENSKINLWAIFNLPLLDFSFQNSEMYYKKLVSILLPILNNPLFFSLKNRDGIFRSLICHFKNILKTNYAHDYFKHLIEIMIQIKWGPNSLFFFSYLLSLIPTSPIYDSTMILLIKNFLEINLNAQNHPIRCATENCFLIQIMNLCIIKDLSLDVFFEFLSVMRRDSFKKNPEIWEKILNFLKSFLTEKITYEFLLLNVDSLGKQSSIHPKKLARIVVLLMNLNIMVTSEKINNILLTFSKVIHDFVDLHKRTYAGDWQDGFVNFIKYFYKELDHSKYNCSELLLQIKEIFNSEIHQLLNTILSRILPCPEIIDTDHIKKYYSTLEILLQVKPMNNYVINFISNTQNSISNSINSNEKIALEKYCHIKFLVIVRKIINFHQIENLYNVELDHSSIVRKLMKFEKINSTLKEDNTKMLRTDLLRNFGYINSKHFENKWFIYSEFVKNNMEFIYTEDIILDYINEALDISNKNSLISIMCVVEMVLKLSSEYYIQSILIQNIVEKCYKLTCDLKNSNLFLPTISKFCSMIFHPKAILESSINTDHYGEYLFKQAQTISPIGHIFIKIFYNSCSEGSGSADDLVKIMRNSFAYALTFGEVIQKDQKCLQDLYDFIETKKTYIFCDESYLNLKDYDIRLYAIRILHLLTKHDSINYILHLLNENDKLRTGSKTRYFLNSYLHRTKLRTLQVLLICDVFINIDEAKKLFRDISSSLFTISHPTNIKFYYQWIMARFAIRYREIRNNIWNFFCPISENQNIIPTWIMIIYFIHLGVEDLDFTEQSMNYILPLLMAQHFAVRLHAQFVFRKLFEFCQIKNNQDLIMKYEAINNGINSKYLPTPEQDYKEENKFYLFKSFHPLLCYNLKTIFHSLPKITDVQDDELIPLSQLQLCKCNVAIENKEDKINQIEYKNIEIFSKTLSPIIHDISPTNVQKKIIPFQEFMSEENKENLLLSKLIVCASLVDRMPNLGGLARTCEIMGISKLILNNKNYTINKEFTSLSVTAEKWLNIQEVKINELPEYMLNIKKQGYTLIGAEQTSKSISLCDIKFPEKTFLLLGNEKTGISADLLPFLEFCIEIPQYGHLRSLNVHVSGAIIIWEYIKQHSKI